MAGLGWSGENGDGDESQGLWWGGPGSGAKKIKRRRLVFGRDQGLL
jgi:hypothetical protein